MRSWRWCGMGSQRAAAADRSMRTALLLGVAVGVAACSPARTTPAPTATTAPIYAIELRLRPQDRAIDVNGTIEIAAADSARSAITLSLGERIGHLSVEVLEPAASAGVARVEPIPLPPKARV